MIYPSFIAMFINPKSNLVPSTNLRWVDSSTIISPLLNLLTIIIFIGCILLTVYYTPWILHIWNTRIPRVSILLYVHVTGCFFRSFFELLQYSLKGLLVLNRNDTCASARPRILHAGFVFSCSL